MIIAKVAPRRAHNPKVVGSNPTPATTLLFPQCDSDDTIYFSWWSERGGPTRSHPEHGSETS